MSERAPLAPIKFKELADALLARADSVVPAWLPGGRFNGHEYVCSSLSGGEGSSLSVNVRSGQWADFASDEKGGDLLSLYAAVHGLTMGKAALQVARDEGLEDVAGVMPDPKHQRVERPAPPPSAPKRRPVVDEGWKTVRPVPATAPEPTFKHYHRAATDILRKSVYRMGGDVLGYVVRFATSDGGKDDLPYTWTQSARDGAAKWNWRQFDAPRPLYLPGGELPKAGQTVVVVEGEKKADVLQALLDAHMPGVYVVVSWPGGCKAWAKAEWAWLAGCMVLLWPDCDSKRAKPTRKELDACADEAERDILEALQPLVARNKQPGMAAMIGLGHHLVTEHGCNAQLLNIPDPGLVPDGWDATDAIETDGWDIDRVMQFFGTAYGLPALDAPEKIDRPADAEDGGSESSFPVASANVGGDGFGAGDGGVGGGPDWLQPFWNKKKHYWMVSRELVIAALENDHNLAGMVALNKLTNNIDLRRDLPGGTIPAGPMTGATDLLLGRYLSQRYGLPSISRAALSEAIETVAQQNQFHPVQEYLQDLSERKVWDGTKRLEKWLPWVIGELDPKTGAALLPPKVHEYLCIVGRLFLLGMVNRVMNPGCKFDYCMVLEGKGGLMKSTLFKVLASKPWFSDTHFDVGRGKDGQEQVQGLWVYELAELANVNKADMNLIKAFVSADTDRYRPSYGRVVETYPRQCVLGGTTNEKHWLRDRTGNRRWWPVPVRNRIKIEWLQKYRDQLLAEAFAEYEQGARYYPLPDEEERLFVPMQDKRLVESTVMSALLEVLTQPPAAAGIGAKVNELTQFVTLKQLNEALHVDAGKSSAALDAQIRSWLDAEGWEYGKKQINGVRAHGYSRPAGWPRNIAPDEEETALAGQEQAFAGHQSPTPPPLTTAAAFIQQEADDEPF